MIISKDNQYIKLYGEVKQKKYRHEHGLFPAEGKRLIEDLILSGLKPSLILYDENFLDSRYLEKYCYQTDDCFRVEKYIFKKLVDTQNSQGIVGIFPMLCPQFNELVVETPSLILILNSIQDPGNLGAIIRNSAAAGVSAIVMEEGTVDLYNPKVIRATMGTIAKIPIFYNLTFDEIIEVLKNNNIKVFLSDMEGDYSYCDMPLESPLAVVLGNEGSGISQKWKDENFSKIFIPQANGVESLNVAMVGGIIGFDFRRRCLK